MMNKTLSKGLSTFLLVSGSVCLAISGVLLYLHAVTILEIQDISVPLVGQLSQLEHRLSVLEQQRELTELHAATRVGSAQEQVTVYSLPAETDSTRLLAVFEVVSEVLSRDKLLSRMSAIDFGEIAVRENVREQPVSVEFDVHTDGLKAVLLLVRLAGLLSVGDVLSSDQIQQLIERTEEENPAGIIALEQFLSVPLIDYAENQRLYEENLRRSFSSTSFVNTLQNVTKTSLLSEAGSLLQSDLGTILRSYKLWPLQMMTIEQVTILPGGAPNWHTLSLELLIYSRSS